MEILISDSNLYFKLTPPFLQPGHRYWLGLAWTSHTLRLDLDNTSVNVYILICWNTQLVNACIFQHTLFIHDETDRSSYIWNIDYHIVASQTLLLYSILLAVDLHLNLEFVLLSGITNLLHRRCVGWFICGFKARNSQKLKKKVWNFK